MTNRRPPRPAAILRIGLLAVALLLGILAALGIGRGGDRAAFRTREAVKASDEGYDVELSPMGTVHFARLPRRIVTVDANYNDMLVALDQGRGLLATGFGNNFHEGFYRQLPGVDPGIDLVHLSTIGGNLDKERLYALRADVHHIDPLQLLRSPGWTRADIDEITRNVGPFFANRFSRDNTFGGPEPYRFYSLWELSAKVGEVYRRPERIAALRAVHDDMLRSITARLPPPERRPRVGLVMPAGPGRFTPFCLSREGFATTQYRALGVIDAFEPIKALTYGEGGGAGATIDLEALLRLDPDVLLMPFGIYQGYKARLEELRRLGENPLASRLRAVQGKRIYPGGTPLQGPIFLIFQTEMAAKQLYPEIFGPFREDGAYPAAERLFDRQQVARIVSARGADAGEQARR